MIIRSFFFFPLNMCELEKIQEPLLFHMIYISIEFKEEGSFISLYQLFFFFFKPFIHLCLLYLATLPWIPIFMTQLGVGNTLMIFDYSFTFNEKLLQTGIFSLSLSRTFLLLRVHLRSSRFCAFFDWYNSERASLLLNSFNIWAKGARGIMAWFCALVYFPVCHLLNVWAFIQRTRQSKT